MNKKIKDGAIFMFWLIISVLLITIAFEVIMKDGGNIWLGSFVNALGVLIWGGFRFRAGEASEKKNNY